jgi:DNA polymerase III delta prime subunit
MIEPHLEKARQQLLDLSGHNRLLNHRKRGQRTLEVIDERMDEVYRLLVAEGRQMNFLALEESELLSREDAPDPDEASESELVRHIFQLAALEESSGDDRHTDRNLQTLLPGTQLQRRLLNLSRVAESALQEQGVNVLYLALGTLEWRAEDDSVRRAPLLLIPVELSRRSVKHRHRIRRTEEEIEVNPALRELCRQHFRAELPDFDEEQPNPASAYLRAVERGLAQPMRWGVLPEINLGIFSFAKLLMYRDLKDERWPDELPITVNPTLGRLFGELPPATDLATPIDASDLDETIGPLDACHVLDADSSQFAAIEAAKAGHNLLISGPPGTGKSQTIANMIGELLVAGRSVLFVSEKMAALDVVRARLNKVGLGDFVADLHSRKTRKADFVRSLAQSLHAEQPPLPSNLERDAATLMEQRRRLNAYVRALHERRAPLEMSVYEAVSRCALLRHAPELAIEIPAYDRWTPQRLADAQEIVGSYARAWERVGDQRAHPWRGLERSDLPLRVRQQIEQTLPSLSHALERVSALIEAVATRLGAAAPACMADAADLADAVRTCLAFDSTARSAMASAAWDDVPAEAAALLRAGAELGQIRSTLEPRWRRDAEEIDLAPVAQRMRIGGKSPLRFLKPSWWSDRALLRRLSTNRKVLADQNTLLQDLDQIAQARRLRSQIIDAGIRGGTLFGALWREDDSDWDACEAMVRDVVRVRGALRGAGASPEHVATLLTEPARDALQADLNEMTSSQDDFRRQWSAFCDVVALDEQAFFDSESHATTTLTNLRSCLDTCAAHGETLEDWTTLVRAREACSAAQLEAVTAITDTSFASSLTDGFSRQFFRLWTDHVLRTVPELQYFRGEDREALIDAFRTSDSRWIGRSTERAGACLGAQRPQARPTFSDSSGLSVLLAEAGKKRRHMPIRRLLTSTAGAVVQKLRPCFMMSPLSVAQFLDPKGLHFDVVIFDEASQVLPEDALGAIARASQVILVGDENQLPPTNFFQSIGAESDDVVHDDDITGIDTTDLESILSLGKAAYPSSHVSLRWHYRSRHESLIAFSNDEFYDGRLRIFPSSMTDRQSFGLTMRHVPDGVYMRGTARNNPVEARTVAEAVMEHARQSPQRSLGVGAFSQSQQQAIEDEIELLRMESDDAAIEQFFHPDRDEPFFVKNLETIQGDERDVILLSVGYARDPDGKLTQHFGPINKEGGWRRLNVLVTRARERCVLFSSIRSEEITARPGMPRGVEALKAYLHFAQHGLQTEDLSSHAAHTAPLQQSVRAALEAEGHTVHSHVGCAGFAVDLGVVDPQRPDRYAVGIEFDGAVYHDAATARDRDRIRQSVLESRGWTVLRVWAADWFRQPDATVARLVADVERAMQKQAEPPATPQPDAAPDLTADDASESEDDAESEQSQGAGPLIPGMANYIRFESRPLGDRSSLLRQPPTALAQLMSQMVEIESPMHVEELLGSVARLHDTRVVGDAEDLLHEAIDVGQREGLFTLREMFLWKPDGDPPTPRWRSSEDAVRRAEHISPEEVAQASVLVVRNEYGVPLDDLAAATIRAMGFQRLGPQLARLGDAGIQRAVERGLIQAGPNGAMVAAHSG